MNEPRRRSWVGPVIGVGLLVVMVGACLGTAFVNFLRFPVRSKAAEAKSHLKALFVAEKAYFADHDVYSETIEKLGFAPERGNRYLYLVSTRGELLVQGAPDGGEHTGVFADNTRTAPKPDNLLLRSSIPAALLSEVGVTCQADGGCEVTMVAAGDLDADATVDLWSVSTKDRHVDGQPVPASVPFNHVNDADE